MNLSKLMRQDKCILLQETEHVENCENSNETKTKTRDCKRNRHAYRQEIEQAEKVRYIPRLVFCPPRKNPLQETPLPLHSASSIPYQGPISFRYRLGGTKWRRLNQQDQNFELSQFSAKPEKTLLFESNSTSVEYNL